MNYLGINKSQLGRITLMLKESAQAKQGDFDSILIDFNNRVDSIKTEKVKAEAIKIGDFTPLYTRLVKNNNLVADDIKSLELLGYSEEDIRQKIDDMWPQCVMKWLTYLKYTAK